MNQNNAILEHLKKGYSITPMEALSKFGCFRLSGRIFDLHKEGHDIRCEIVNENGKRYGKYYIPRREKQQVFEPMVQLLNIE